jgi:hypothetical protein
MDRAKAIMNAMRKSRSDSRANGAGTPAGEVALWVIGNIPAASA